MADKLETHGRAAAGAGTAEANPSARAGLTPKDTASLPCSSMAQTESISREQDAPSLPQPHGRTSRIAYGVIGAALVLYVGLCTPHRDSIWEADAWEHHRAVVALTQEGWWPGNPTYATDEPSIRYSPYSIALAALCRWTGADPYAVLSGAAVVNTALLIVSLYLLLAVYGMTAIGPYVLIVMVSFYGSAPGYANTYALADLPWHQVNPSALSFPLALFMVAALRAGAHKCHAWWEVLALAVVGAACVLTHGHTGVFAFIGMAAAALAGPADVRIRLFRRIAVVAVLSGVLCMAWPWFDFLAAVRNVQDREYWFNPFVSVRMLTVWSLPALACVPFVISLRRNELIRMCLLTAGVCYGLALLAFPARSSLLARLPMPALVLLNVAVAGYLWSEGLLNPRSWSRSVRDVLSFEQSVSLPAGVNLLLVAALVYCLVPQIVLIARDPALARPYIAPILAKPDKRLHLMDRFDRLLEPVGRRDVVLSDAVTSWPVPSVRGRIVAALHYETFTPGQPARDRDVFTFFATGDWLTRQEILQRYGVRWILLNESTMSPYVIRDLLEPDAVVGRVDDLVLMDAGRWLDARRARLSDSPSPPAGLLPPASPLRRSAGLDRDQLR